MNITSVISAVKGIANVDAAKRLLLIGTGFVRKNAPQFLTAASVISLGGAVVSTAKATVKSKEVIDDAEFQRFMELRQKHGKDYMPEDKEITLPLEEKVKLCWKYYIPAVLSTAASAGCAIASTSIYADRFATVTALLALSEADNKELKAKMEEILGKETVEKIQEAIGDDRVKETMEVDEIKPAQKEVVVNLTDDVILPVVDSYGVRWKATPAEVRAAISAVNSKLKFEDAASLYDFYSFIKPGDTLESDVSGFYGWDKEIWGDEIRIKMDIELDSDDRPYIHVRYLDMPEPYSGSYYL